MPRCGPRPPAGGPSSVLLFVETGDEGIEEHQEHRAVRPTHPRQASHDLFLERERRFRRERAAGGCQLESDVAAVALLIDPADVAGFHEALHDDRGGALVRGRERRELAEGAVGIVVEDVEDDELGGGEAVAVLRFLLREAERAGEVELPEVDDGSPEAEKVFSAMRAS